MRRRNSFPVAKPLIQQNNAALQLIAATHSPLVMASAEPLFNAELDAWFDLDMEEKSVVLTHRPFAKHGDAEGWLMSEAFDLPN